MGEKPSKTPALVATAFPPLNPAKIGKVCPKTAKRPKTIGEIPEFKESRKENGQSSFKKSIVKTMIPAFFPKIRKVLVVPVLPEPCSRKLIWKKRFSQSIIPKEWSLTDRLKLKHLFLLSYFHYIKKPSIEKAISGVQV